MVMTKFTDKIIHPWYHPNMNDIPMSSSKDNLLNKSEINVQALLPTWKLIKHFYFRIKSRKTGTKLPSCSLQTTTGTPRQKLYSAEEMTTLQVKTVLVAMATKILELAIKLEQQSPAWRLKLRRRIESVSLIKRLKFFTGDQT